MTASFSDKLKHFLSDPRVTIAVIGIALVSRLIHLIYFYTIGFDISYQVIAMHNFVTGDGITISKAIPADIGTTIFEPLINWPPGYTLLLTPFYLLSGYNYIIAGLTLDVIAAITLIFTCRAILKTLSVPLHFINLFTLFNGFYIYRFYQIASSDAIAVSIFLVAIYFTLKLFQQPQHWRSKAVIITICLFICSTIKYLFVPVVFVIPALLIVVGIADKVRSLKKAGLFCFLVLAIIIGGLLYWQQSLSGSMGYVSATGRGFYPAHLLSAYPFIPAAFLQPGTTGILINQPSETGDPIYRLFQWVHILLLLLIFYHTLRVILKNRFHGLTASGFFYYLSFSLCLAITLVLAALSLRVTKEEIMPGYFWTYVEELRYYGLATILFHIGLFVAYTHYRPSVKWSRGAWTILLLLLVLPELCRGIIFDTRRVLQFRKEEYTWQFEYDFQQYADNIIAKERSIQAFDNLVVTGSSHYMNNRVAVYSHAAVLTDNTAVNDLNSINASRPALLLVMLHENELAAFKPFIEAKRGKVAGYFGGLYFYTVYVTPH
jgi:hypothetical protein